MTRPPRSVSKLTPEGHRRLADRHLEIAERTGGIRAFFDGCCEPKNPGGTAGWGAVIFDGPNRVWEDSGFVEPAPTTSNNIAEYLAVGAVLARLAEMGAETGASVFGDSRLVICQLWGWPAGARRWKIHGVDTPDRPKGFYADAAAAARDALRGLPNVRGYWIPRERNDVADDLSKSHLRRLGVEFRIQPEGDEHE